MTPEERAESVLASDCEHVEPDDTGGALARDCSYCIEHAIRAAVEDEREACALLIEQRNAEVLGRQYGASEGFRADVDTMIRVATVLLPDLAEAIRARGKA